MASDMAFDVMYDFVDILEVGIEVATTLTKNTEEAATSKSDIVDEHEMKCCQ